MYKNNIIDTNIKDNLYIVKFNHKKDNWGLIMDTAREGSFFLSIL